MEPTKAAIQAALDAVASVFPVDIARGYVSIHDIAEAAVRAAFAAVPDPTEAIYKENERGGEARMIAARIGDLLNVDLTREVVGGDVWSQKNMERVLAAAHAFMRGDNK
jgi:hypothetical protein